MLNSRLSKLEGAGDLGPHIIYVVKNKTVVASPGAGDAANVAIDTTPNPTLSVAKDGASRGSADAARTSSEQKAS